MQQTGIVPFLNLRNDGYLSAGYLQGGAYEFEIRNLYTGQGTVSDNDYFGFGRVIPVHNGDVGRAVTPVPEPETWALLVAALAALGVRRKRTPG